MEKEKTNHRISADADCAQDPEASSDYYVYLVCQVCHRSGWQLQEGLGLTREEILNRHWEFKCPVHGSQLEKPLQANPKATFLPEYMPVSANLIM
jgi:hypothetical protein